MSEKIGFVAALSKAQLEFKAIVKDLEVSFGNTKYKYADLAAVIEAVQPALTANGLAVTQTTGYLDGHFVLITELLHVSGEKATSYWPLPAAGKPQEMGSALTYARRYSLSAILNVASEADDDGQAGGQAKNPTKAEVQKELQRVADKAPQKPQDGKLTLDLGGGEVTYHGTMTAFLDAFDTALNSADDKIAFFDLNSKTLGVIQAKGLAAANQSGNAIVKRISEIHDRIHTLSNPDNPLRGA